MAEPESHAAVEQVVIVGAGPTGLALAAELQRLGIPATILDRLAEGLNTSRAAVVHARTLEVLEPLDVTPRLLQQGLHVAHFRIRDRSRILAIIDFSTLPTAYPFVLLISQAQTEAVLLERLHELGGHVERPCEVLSILDSPDPEAPLAVHYRNDGETKVLFTRWLVGCDGMHSLVRQEAAIPFEGAAYEESFVLGDVEMDWPLGRDEASLFFSPLGLLLVVPLPGGHFRIIAAMPQAPDHPSLGDLQQLLTERGPDPGTGGATIRVGRVLWSSRFHIHHRLASCFRQGRILLAGDAAHVHSPAGGQGMNTGIQDAISLADALHQALRQGNTLALDAWQTRRREIARSVVQMTDQATRMATASSPLVRLFRNAAMDLVGHVPAAQHAIARKLAELDNL